MVERYANAHCPLAGKAGNQFPRFGSIMANLDTLIIFAEVVEANSFSEAERVVHVEVY